MNHLMLGKQFFMVETLYSIIVTLLIFFIYFKAREMYKLTEHRGLKYFSLTFLFFGIAHLLRFFFRIFFRLFINKPHFFMPEKPPHHFGNVFYIYASVMAGMILLYSLVWKNKQWKEKSVILIINIITIIVIIIDFISKNPFVHISFITALFGITLIFSIIKKIKSKKKHTYFIIYVLIFLIWILNIIAIEAPKFMFTLKILIYFISIGLYSLILMRVNKNGKKR